MQIEYRYTSNIVTIENMYIPIKLYGYRTSIHFTMKKHRYLSIFHYKIGYRYTSNVTTIENIYKIDLKSHIVHKSFGRRNNLILQISRGLNMSIY